jgi:hypothetical protein
MALHSILGEVSYLLCYERDSSALPYFLIIVLWLLSSAEEKA